MERVLKTEVDREIKKPNAKAMILAKPYSYSNNWRVSIFTTLDDGRKYIESYEVSGDSLYSPCSERKYIRKSVAEMNDIWIRLQKEDGYKYQGKFERDYLGGYRRIG